MSDHAIESKIEKLLNLARGAGASPNEAAVAAAKAQEHPGADRAAQ